MSKEKDPEVVIGKEDFQLVAKDFHTKNPLFNMAIDGVVKTINFFDANHDGKSDLAQMAPIGKKAFPVLMAVLPLVQWDKVWLWVLGNFVKPESKQEFTNLVATLDKHTHEAAAIVVVPSNPS